VNVLLDVNAMLAWEHANSPHHAAFHGWVAQQDELELWTCALAELGFIRVSMQVFGYDKTSADQSLRRLKRATAGFVEEAPSPRLPAWAKSASKTTDAYLVQLARANDLKLATFDRGIRDAAVLQIVA
jgi:predicted nucleic acid-binding protein